MTSASVPIQPLVRTTVGTGAASGRQQHETVDGQARDGVHAKNRRRRKDPSSHARVLSSFRDDLARPTGRERVEASNCGGTPGQRPTAPLPPPPMRAPLRAAVFAARPSLPEESRAGRRQDTSLVRTIASGRGDANTYHSPESPSMRCAPTHKNRATRPPSSRAHRRRDVDVKSAAWQNKQGGSRRDRDRDLPRVAAGASRRTAVDGRSNDTRRVWWDNVGGAPRRSATTGPRVNGATAPRTRRPSSRGGRLRFAAPNCLVKPVPRATPAS